MKGTTRVVTAFRMPQALFSQEFSKFQCDYVQSALSDNRMLPFTA